ncbi:MBL fold metallo-hydrolase [Siccirubricoccus deserti]
MTLDWVLETHVHADHLTASPYVKARAGGRIGIGEHIRDVQAIFRPVFGAEDLLPDGGDFDVLFADGAEFAIGGLTAKVLHVPGHTPACIAYVIGDAAFVGDTLFMPDYGTARCDFPGAMRGRSGAASIGCWRCRPPPASSPATTTRRPAATASPGKAPSPSSGRATRM